MWKNPAFCKKRNQLFSRVGFSLIELLVVISIITLLFGFGMATYNDFNRRQMVSQSAKAIKNNLRLAQSKAMAGEKDCSAGVCGGNVSGCGNDNPLSDAEKSLEGWFVELTGAAGSQQINVYGRCGGTTFYSQALSILPSLTVSFGQNPLVFLPLAQGVNPAAYIWVSGFNKLYCLQITETGELKELGFRATCP